MSGREVGYWLMTIACGAAGVWCLNHARAPNKEDLFSPWWYWITFVWAMCAMSLFELCAVAVGLGY